MTHKGIQLIMPWRGQCGSEVKEDTDEEVHKFLPGLRVFNPELDRNWESWGAFGPSHRPFRMSPNPAFLNSALSNEQSRQDLWNLSVDSSYACAFLGREKIIRGVCWKVKEESASIVIKAEMNDGFRGCGVDRLDDRGAKGPLQF